ncbi:MAG: SAM-dependent methyltransferase [Clostridia bacterium]|nr:SAM-dependent methyltransferase [Clostridia bacterium]
MEQKSMTALVSAFSRAYHAENNKVKIFDDCIARLLLTDEEYHQISKSMADGIDFFNPAFTGTQEAALRWVVDNQLSPSTLGRAAFAEKALQTAVAIGAKQYLILGAGYDTFAYRQAAWADQLQIFEIDHPSTAKDKQMRLEAAKIRIPNNVHFVSADFTKKQWLTPLTKNTAFNHAQISFCSILGVAYYLTRETFEELISVLSSILPTGGAVIFDYPDENNYTDKAGDRAKKQALLAGAANEKMLTGYSYEEMEKILSSFGFFIYEHLTPTEMTKQYFAAYNHANPSFPMTGFDNVNYCLAVRKK